MHSGWHHATGGGWGADQAPTLYHTRSQEKPYHIDYVWLPDRWLDRVTGCHLGSYDSWVAKLSASVGLSDHVPLVVDLNLGTESFAADGDHA